MQATFTFAGAPALKRRERLVWSYIRKVARSTGLCFAFTETIARAIGYSVRTVQLALKALVRLGLLAPAPSPEDGRRTVYRVAEPTPELRPECAQTAPGLRNLHPLLKRK